MKQKINDKVLPYAHWLYHIKGIGKKTIRYLLAEVHSPEELYHLPEKRLEALLSSSKRGQELAGRIAVSKKDWDIGGAYERLQKMGISFTCLGHDDYPERLAQISDAPYGLYFRGRLPAAKKPAVAIIGARNCSEYGRRMAEWFGGELAAAGVEIISGMARGIDGIGQRAALAAGGYSLAVMGCGADVCYPAENRDLYRTLCAQGGVCSEYLPGTPPQSSLFPPRNRIISGLADVILVIEAKDRSGTLITVDMALEQGKEVYALPGRVTEALSGGCNRLLQQGASPALSPDDMLRGLTGNSGFCLSESGTYPALSDLQIDLLETLDNTPQEAGKIKQRLLLKCGRDIALPELMSQLVKLSLSGYARQIGNGYFAKS